MDLNANQNQAEQAEQAEQAKRDIYNDAEEDTCNVQKIPFSIDPPLPEQFNEHIAHLLHMMAHIYDEGNELGHVIAVVVDKDNNAHLLDGEGCPSQFLLASWINRYAAEKDGIAVIVVTEGFEISEEVAELWAKGGRPEGMRVQDHPDHYEALRISVETINGTWSGHVKLDKYAAPAEGEEAKPRTVHGEMLLEKADEVMGPLNNLLNQNREKIMATMPIELRESLTGIMNAIKKGFNKLETPEAPEADKEVKDDKDDTSPAKPE